MRRHPLVAVLATTAALVLPGSVLAGGSGPDAAFQIRMGAFLPDGDSNFWRDNEEFFTQDTSDFDGFTFGVSLIYAVNNDLEVGLNANVYDESTATQYRDFVDLDGFPILHGAQLETLPLSFDVRWIIGGRYRGASRHHQAVKPVFFVGAGAGVNLWEYEEIGDFVDFSDDTIFFDRFKASGAELETHVLTGLELPLSRSINVLLEGRYSFSEAELEDDFAGLGDLDLGGPTLSAGVSFRF